jgi:hypothetical protein
MNSPQFVRRINADLRPVLGDDRIVIGAQVLRVPSRRVLSQLSSAVYLASAVALLFVFLWARDHWRAGPALAGFCIAEVTAVALGLARIFIQRPMLLAVTRRQLICCRLSGVGKHPTAVATGPLAKTRITVYRYRPQTTTLRCLIPGSGPLTLSSIRGSQDELDQVVAVAHTAGVRVTAAQDEGTGGIPAPDPRLPRKSEPGHNGVYHTPAQASAPQSRRTDRLGEEGRADGPGTDYHADVDAAARPQRRREYPGEHRRSGRGGDEPSRS